MLSHGSTRWSERRGNRRRDSRRNHQTAGLDLVLSGAIDCGSTIGWIRVGVGLLLAVAPGAFVRRFVDDEASRSLILFTRTVGMRDLTLGIGTLAGDLSGSMSDLERWDGPDSSVTLSTW